MKKKGRLPDLAILEELPVKVDLLLLVDRFRHFKQPRKKVFDLVRKEYLELVSRGIYFNLKSKEFKDASPEKLASALYFPSYVSAEWALQFYDLLSDRVYTITSVTPNKTVQFKTSLGNFEYQHLHKHYYPVGYEISAEHDFAIARPEKALLDSIKIRGRDPGLKTEEIEGFLSEDLRINVPLLLEIVSVKNIRELMGFYHRNSVELRILKWILDKMENKNESN